MEKETVQKDREVVAPTETNPQAPGGTLAPTVPSAAPHRKPALSPAPEALV